jgi:hypothetical protein
MVFTDLMRDFNVLLLKEKKNIAIKTFFLLHPLH